MTRPDLNLVAVLVYTGLLTKEQGHALVNHYGKAKSYDNPVPISLDVAIDNIADLFEELEDDDEIDERLDLARSEPAEEPVDAVLENNLVNHLAATVTKAISALIRTVPSGGA